VCRGLAEVRLGGDDRAFADVSAFAGRFVAPLGDRHRRPAARRLLLFTTEFGGGGRNRLAFGAQLLDATQAQISRAVGAVQLTQPVGRDIEARTERALQRVDHRHVARHSAGEHEARLEADATHQLDRTATERDHRAHHDVLGGDAVRQMVDHFGFGEYRANAADRLG